MIIRLFLKKEIDIEIKNYKGTALYAAAYEKYAAVIELLLEKMANINTENAKDRTALYKAAAKRYEKVVRLLLEKKIDMNEDKEGRTVLHAAVKGRDVAVEDAALRAACYGVEMAVKGADVENWSAQCKAARKGHKTVIRLLRKHEAAQRRLLKNHADINTTADHGKRPTSEGMEECSFLSEEIKERPSKRAELAAAVVEQIFQTRSQEFKHHDTVLAFPPKPVDGWYPCTSS
jgi:ankyrin repeat protein